MKEGTYASVIGAVGSRMAGIVACGCGTGGCALACVV